MPAEVFNAPTWWRPAIQAFVAKAYPIGSDLAVSITSWQRTRRRNREVVGHDASQHLIATAWDVSGPDQDTYAARARQAGLVVINEGDHIHVQLYRSGIVPGWVYDMIASA